MTLAPVLSEPGAFTVDVCHIAVQNAPRIPAGELLKPLFETVFLLLLLLLHLLQFVICSILWFESRDDSVMELPGSAFMIGLE